MPKKICDRKKQNITRLNYAKLKPNKHFSQAGATPVNVNINHKTPYLLFIWRNPNSWPNGPNPGVIEIGTES